jgi:hypothetical protein
MDTNSAPFSFVRRLFTILYVQKKKYTSEIELKIKAAENNLGFWIRIEGEPK